MMARRQTVRTRLGDVVDITQPIDISGSLVTYNPGSLFTAAPPITTSVVSGSTANAGMAAQLAAEAGAATHAALSQGFLSPSTASLWLQQNGVYVAGGLALLVAMSLFSGGGGGRRRR
jgi:hypothetical protein